MPNAQTKSLAETPAKQMQRSVTGGNNSAPQSPTAMQLQDTLGNRLLSRKIHAKLKVSQSGDPLEREADQIADQIVSGQPLVSIQRKCGCTMGGATCPVCEEEQLHPMALDGTAPATVTTDVETKIDSLRGGGHPLDGDARTFFESRFGADFGEVRLHTDAIAATTADAVQARAFTTGTDVIFNAGEFAPTTTEGRRLLAHELTHVMQQRGLETTLQRIPGDTDAGVSGPEEAGTAALQPSGPTTVSEFDPGLIGADGRPSTASPLAALQPAPPPGADAIGWFDNVVSSNAAFMTHQLRARVNAGATLREGEDAVRAWIDEFQAATDRAAFNLSDTSGITDLSRSQQMWVERARRALPVMRGVLLDIEVEHIRFEQEFLVRGEFVIAGLLDLSRERVETEAKRYGIVRHERHWTRMVHDGLARSPEPAVSYSYEMADGAASQGLASAAGDLAGQARRVIELTMAYQDTQVLIPGPSVDPGVMGMELGCADKAACAAAADRLAVARHDYDVMRFEKERDYPLLAAYAELPTEDALWPLQQAVARLEGLSEGATKDNAQKLFAEIDERRSNIDDTAAALLKNDLVLWELAPALAATAAEMNLDVTSWQMRWVHEAAAHHAANRAIVDIALGVLALGLGILAAIPTGGSSLVAAGTFVAGLGAAGLSTYFAVDHLRQYMLNSAASGTDFDRARAVSSAEPSLFWLAVDIVGAIADVHSAMAAFRALSIPVSEALALRRASVSAEELARAEGAIEDAARRAEDLHPGQGLGERVREGLRREAARDGRGTEAAMREWEAGINTESHAFLVDHPDVRLRYTQMTTRVRQALTFCASNCVLPTATIGEAQRLETMLRTWGDGDMTRLQQFLHANADSLEPALARLEGARNWDDVQHLIAEEARGASFAPADNPFAGLSEREIDAALDEMFSPALSGGARPTIDGHRVPLRARRRLDIQAIPRLAGETARDALARVRRVMGVRLDEIDAVRRCWERARTQVLTRNTLDASNYADLYDRTRRAFWSEVRSDAEASSHFSNAGFSFPGADGSAPMLQTGADLSATEIRISLDHIAEKAIGDNWRRALDADNLRMEFAMPNTYREIIQARHPELR